MLHADAYFKRLDVKLLLCNKIFVELCVKIFHILFNCEIKTSSTAQNKERKKMKEVPSLATKAPAHGEEWDERMGEKMQLIFIYSVFACKILLGVNTAAKINTIKIREEKKKHRKILNQIWLNLSSHVYVSK